MPQAALENVACKFLACLLQSIFFIGYQIPSNVLRDQNLMSCVMPFDEREASYDKWKAKNVPPSISPAKS